MKLFHKESDMICNHCNKLISHKDVNWKPREIPVEHMMKEANMPQEDMKLLKKQKILKDIIASPNQIFGVPEYEYHGQCPECKTELTLFWFGEDSIKRNKDKVIEKRPFVCSKCNHLITRELQVWYSVSMKENDEIVEYFLTLCPNCKDQQIYPFEYDLQKGIIK